MADVKIDQNLDTFTLKPSEFSDYRDFLRGYIDFKKSTSKHWSFGVWAKQLQLASPSTLIMIANGQRNPGPRLLQTLISFFGMDSLEARYFSDLVRVKKSEKDISVYRRLVAGIQQKDPGNVLRILTKDEFDVLADWRHYAIREMIHLADFREDIRWISQRLKGLSPKREIRDALYRLIKVGLLVRDAAGRLRYGHDQVRSPDDIISSALKEFHRHALQRAQDSLDISMAEREISGGCFAIKREDLPRIKTAIRRFQHELCESFEQRDGDEVYHLEVAFFPITNAIPAPKKNLH